MNRAIRHLMLLAAAALAGCKGTGAPSASPSASAGAASAMSEDEKTVYALGAMVGQRFVGPMRPSDKELDIFVRAVRETARGGKPEFAVAEYAPRFNQLAAARQAAAGTALRDAAAAETGAVKLPSGVVYRTLQPGSGASPKPTDVVRVHYHGTLPDGRVFDSSVERGQPAEFRLDGVIPCWTQGVQRMKLGEKAKLVCPPEAAYAGGTPDGTIPPGATLVFEVELLEIKGQ